MCGKHSSPTEKLELPPQLAVMNVKKLADDDIPRLHDRILSKYKNQLGGVVAKVPPLHKVNHWICLVDKGKQYAYHLPCCPDSLNPQLAEKIQLYTSAKWWIMASVPQAAPMLCILKKTGKSRTVIDCRKHNDNMVKDVTPFPDQDQIRMDVTRAGYRSKIDLSNMYEQVCVEPEDVKKTAFSTIFGTFLSQVMQQGDCIAPATFQRLMTVVLREYIGQFIHVYLNDIFMFSNTLEEHERHL